MATRARSNSKRRAVRVPVRDALGEAVEVGMGVRRAGWATLVTAKEGWMVSNSKPGPYARPGRVGRGRR